MRMRTHNPRTVCKMASPPAPSSSLLDPLDAAPGKKRVLVCYGDRKRPVSFSSCGNGSDITRLLVAANNVYEGVCVFDSKTIVQVKSAEWGGEFVDAVDFIPENSIVRLMQEPAASVSDAFYNR